MATHIAIKDIPEVSYGAIEFTVLTDYIQSDTFRATALNNGKRLLWDEGTKTLHMVYKSRDYVYYTKKENPSDPASKWLPAYPVGKGIYPVLMQRGTDMGVIWTGHDGPERPAKQVFFRRGTNHSWDPDPFAVIREDPTDLRKIEYSPPSAVIYDNQVHVVFERYEQRGPRWDWQLLLMALTLRTMTGRRSRALPECLWT